MTVNHMAALVQAHGSVLSDGLGSIPGHASPERKAVRHDTHSGAGTARPADERQLHGAGVPARVGRIQANRKGDHIMTTADFIPTDSILTQTYIFIGGGVLLLVLLSIVVGLFALARGESE